MDRPVVDKLMKKKPGNSKKGTIEIIEEAVHLLRMSPMSLLSLYYTGSLPFVLGLLYFWGDMSRNAFAGEYCASASLGLAGLFIWMKCWHSVFAVSVRAVISQTPVHEWSFRRIMRLVVIQTIIQPSGFFLVPLALIVTLPFCWVYAFYQNALLLRYDKPLDIKNVINESLRQARLWPGQNHVMLYIISLFSVIILLNVSIVIYAFPHILKTYLGIETIFAMSGASVLNTTFLATVCGITFLCTDPLIKTIYVLRCFYGASLMTGEDLKVRLKSFFSQSKVMGGLLILVLCGGILQYTPELMAGQKTDTSYDDSSDICNLSESLKIPSSGAMFGQRLISAEHPDLHQGNTCLLQFINASATVSPEKLDRSIKEIMTRREFAWRMPREKKDNNEHEFLLTPLQKFVRWVRIMYTKTEEILEKWADKIFPEWDMSSENTDKDWRIWGYIVLYLVLGVAVSMLVIHLFRQFLGWKKHQIKIGPDIAPVAPDLTDDNVRADDLPVDQWKVLAWEMIEKGSLRLALRALYLATLARLAEEKLISIAKYKSNRDYETELKRRAHEKKELLDIFSMSVNFFDRVWYGMYEVNMDDVNFFAANQERIFSFARQ